jgi:hypothetical protein
MNECMKEQRDKQGKWEAFLNSKILTDKYRKDAGIRRSPH